MTTIRTASGAVRAGVSLAVAFLAASLAPAPAAAAESWPQRNVRFIVPLGPGAGVDIGARLFADRLSTRWGKPVVVENRPGGDAIVAITAFVGAHDDHTLLFAPAATFTAHPYLHDRLPYDQADLIPVARVSNTLVAMTAPSSLNASTFKDLMDQVRGRPGRMNWATATGFSDFLFEAYLKNTGLDMSKVPYRDPVQPATDAAEGRIEFYWAAFAIVRPHFDGGKLKLLAVSNTVHIPGQTQVPTIAEAGFPALTYDGLVGVFAPREMTADVRERIAADITEVGADPEIRQRLLITGQLVSPAGGAEFGAAIDAQRAVVAGIAKDMGIPAASH